MRILKALVNGFLIIFYWWVVLVDDDPWRRLACAVICGVLFWELLHLDD